MTPLSLFGFIVIVAIAISLPFTVKHVSTQQNSTAYASPGYQSIYPDGPYIHCTPLVNGSRSCWNNVGDNLDFYAFYKNNIKNPIGKISCWVVSNPPNHFPSFGLDYITYQNLMATPPYYTRVISPLPPSGANFQIQITGIAAAWCRSDLYNGQNIIGTGMFGLGAPGQSTI